MCAAGACGLRTKNQAVSPKAMWTHCTIQGEAQAAKEHNKRLTEVVQMGVVAFKRQSTEENI